MSQPVSLKVTQWKMQKRVQQPQTCCQRRQHFLVQPICRRMSSLFVAPISQQQCTSGKSKALTSMDATSSLCFSSTYRHCSQGMKKTETRIEDRQPMQRRLDSQTFNGQLTRFAAHQNRSFSLVYPPGMKIID
eukprot:1159235-Pelagomonas_calceolata.AAC.4